MSTFLFYYLKNLPITFQDLEISYSFTTDTNDPSPDFRLPEYSHGTSCAGEIVMIKDNGICGTGVAYNAKLGGIM